MNNKYNKNKRAVALKYYADVDVAPVIKAKGNGVIAHHILEKAKEHHIPIQEDPTLVELMAQLNINDTIPEDLYQAVAEVFAFVYQLDKNLE